MTRQSPRISVPQLVTVALLALAATDSAISSAAKCQYKKRATEAPSVVEDAGQESTDAPTGQFSSYDASQTGGGSTFSTEAPSTQYGSYEASQTSESSSFTETSTESPSTEIGSYGASQKSEGSATTTETSAQGSFESGGVSQGNSSTTQETSGGSSPSTTSGGHASFGDVTSASGQCVVGNPSTYVTRKDVDWVWENTMKEYVPQFKNLIFDQLVTNKGSLTYCVRWDNDQKLTKAVASKFQDMLAKQMDLWHQWLVGYECWPYEKVDITIVGYAVKDKSIMDWDDDSLGTIYEGLLDDSGSPKCPDECYKHQGQAASADTSSCKGKPFDMSLWPSTSPGEGAIGTGGDWGQRVEVNDMLNTMGDEHMMVLLHEMGHGFGLPEMYVAENKPNTYPACVMDNSMTLTDGDGWLLRSVLENIKSRYSFAK